MQLKLRDRQLRAAGREGEADELYKVNFKDYISIFRTKHLLGFDHSQYC